MPRDDRHSTNTKPKKPSSVTKKISKTRRYSSSRAIGQSSNARLTSGSSAEMTTQGMKASTTSEEKNAYDNFFTYLPLNAWLYDPKRDPVPSFPRTDEEISQLIRKPTQSDYDSLAEDIAAGRVRVNLQKD